MTLAVALLRSLVLAACQAGTLKGMLAARWSTGAAARRGTARAADPIISPTGDAGTDLDAAIAAPDAAPPIDASSPPASDAGVLHPDAEPPPPCSMPLAMRI